MEPTTGWNEMQRILELLYEGPYPDEGANLYRTIKIAMVDKRIPYDESLGLIGVHGKLDKGDEGGRCRLG